jgi:ribonuclease HI
MSTSPRTSEPRGPASSNFEGDSEDEGHPRQILDPNCDVTILNCTADDGQPVTIKLNDFAPMVKLSNGQEVPFPGTISVRPIPKPDLVARARAAMGDGANGVFSGTLFQLGGPDLTPQAAFPTRSINFSLNRPVSRFAIRRRLCPPLSLKTMLMYTDGACLNNGSTADTPRGGYAFVFNSGIDGVVASALENKGLDGSVYRHTSNRAELRAVVSSLQFRKWYGEGWERVVIAADSEYVVLGATTWVRTWAGRDWRTSAGKPVLNQDLWRRLLEQLQEYANAGCEVSFWRVPREWNTIADAGAKMGANMMEPDESTLSGVYLPNSVGLATVSGV